MHVVSFSIGTLSSELRENGWTDRDAIYNAEFGGSRGHYYMRM